MLIDFVNALCGVLDGLEKIYPEKKNELKDVRENIDELVEQKLNRYTQVSLLLNYIYKRKDKTNLEIWTALQACCDKVKAGRLLGEQKTKKETFDQYLAELKQGMRFLNFVPSFEKKKEQQIRDALAAESLTEKDGSTLKSLACDFDRSLARILGVSLESSEDLQEYVRAFCKSNKRIKNIKTSVLTKDFKGTWKHVKEDERFQDFCVWLFEKRLKDKGLPDRLVYVLMRTLPQGDGNIPHQILGELVKVILKEDVTLLPSKFVPRSKDSVESLKDVPRSKNSVQISLGLVTRSSISFSMDASYMAFSGVFPDSDCREDLMATVQITYHLIETMVKLEAKAYLLPFSREIAEKVDAVGEYMKKHNKTNLKVFRSLSTDERSDFSNCRTPDAKSSVRFLALNERAERQSEPRNINRPKSSHAHSSRPHRFFGKQLNFGASKFDSQVDDEIKITSSRK